MYDLFKGLIASALIATTPFAVHAESVSHRFISIISEFPRLRGMKIDRIEALKNAPSLIESMSGRWLRTRAMTKDYSDYTFLEEYPIQKTCDLLGYDIAIDSPYAFQMSRRKIVEGQVEPTQQVDYFEFIEGRKFFRYTRSFDIVRWYSEYRFQDEDGRKRDQTEIAEIMDPALSSDRRVEYVELYGIDENTAVLFEPSYLPDILFRCP